MRPFREKRLIVRAVVARRRRTSAAAKSSFAPHGTVNLTDGRRSIPDPLEKRRSIFARPTGALDENAGQLRRNGKANEGATEISLGIVCKCAKGSALIEETY